MRVDVLFITYLVFTHYGFNVSGFNKALSILHERTVRTRAHDNIRNKKQKRLSSIPVYVFRYLCITFAYLSVRSTRRVSEHHCSVRRRAVMTLSAIAERGR